MKLAFITTNKNEVAVAARALAAHGIEVEHYPLDLIEPQGKEAVDVARSKVLQAFRKLQRPVMVREGALHIDEFDGFPGPYVKDVTAQIGVEGFLRLLSHRSSLRQRAARFTDVIAFMARPLTTQPKIFGEEVAGALALRARGTNLRESDLDSIFLPDGYKRTLAEMDDDEYEKYRSDTITEHPYEGLARTFLDFVRRA